MGVRIITDSTADIPPDAAQAMDVAVVPLKVLWGQKTYRDGIDLNMDTFYDRLAESETLPTTSQPAPEEFSELYNSITGQGDSVVAILISSNLSGTVQSAQIAQKMCEGGDIHVVDSLNTAIGLRLMVAYAARLRDEGKDAGQIAEAIEGIKSRVRMLAIMDTFTYLVKGGRVSKAVGMVGSMLNIKPVFELIEGRLVVIEKARGMSAAMGSALSAIKEIDPMCPVYFGYARDKARAERLREKIAEKHGMENSSIHPVGCVIGTHTGPGACAIAYLEKRG